MTRRTTVPLAVLWYAAACILTAQGDAGLIEWSKTRKLTRADYRGSAVLQGLVAALSSVGIRASWTCDGDQFTPHIRAVFDPSQSTWDRAHSGFEAASRQPLNATDGQVLQHEQTHFDIAEVMARKIRSHFATLTDVCVRRGGTVPLAAIVEDYQRELDDEEARYDRQTVFGLDGRMQSEWTSKTLRALQDGAPK